MTSWIARVVAAAGAGALVLAGMAPAGADDIYNTLDGTVDATAESIALTEGGSTGSVSFAVRTQNGDGKNGCNLTGSTTLVVSVSSSDPSKATVSPSSLTFGSCDDLKSVTVTPVAAGSTSVTLSQTSNSTAGTFNLAPAAFDVVVNAPAPPSNTAPVLSLPSSPVVVEATSAAGAVATYVVTASDAEDAPDPTPLCSPASGTGFPIGSTTVECAVTDSGGLEDTGTFTVQVVDSTDPLVQISTGAVAAPSGWYNIDSSGTGGVTVSVTATDAVGVDDVTCTVDGAASSLVPGSPVTLGDGEHEVACTATDAAENEGSDSASFQVDQTAPTLTGAPSPAPNADGWNNGDVLVSYTCSDATSGLDTDYGNNDPTDGCWADDAVTTDGLTSFHRSIVDQAGNVTEGDFSVRRDTVAPTISGTAVPGANSNGWNNGDVVVDFTCFDGLSTLAGCEGDTTLTEEGTHTVVGTATDKAGNTNTASVGPVQIDRTLPEITATRTPANDAGWNNGAVTVTFACTDALSGVDTFSEPAVVDTEGVDQTATGTCTDLAGNTASLTVDEINIDLSAPTIAGSRTPQANADGWNNGDVIVSFVCSDTGPSGVATDTVAGDTLTEEGTDQSVTSSGDCVDAAGNAAAPATVSGINIDRTAPVISGGASPAANAAGWNNTDVTVSFSCADSGAVQSGIGTDTVAGGTLTADGADQAVTSTGSCVDRAGNAAAPATVGGIDIDKTAPSVTVTVTPNPVVLNGSASASATATDALSGVVGSATCGPVSNAAIGTGTVSCSATDAAGNTGTGSATYSVVYGWNGFFQPIDNSPAGGDVVFNKAKAGQSIPAKFSLGGNQGLDIIAAGYPKVTQVACTATGEDLIETYAASTANNGLVYDAAANQYNYVWKTQSSWANSCRKFDLMLVDGTHHVAYFKFTK